MYRFGLLTSTAGWPLSPFLNGRYRYTPAGLLQVEVATETSNTEFNRLQAGVEHNTFRIPILNFHRLNKNSKSLLRTHAPI